MLFKYNVLALLLMLFSKLTVSFLDIYYFLNAVFNWAIVGFQFF